MHGTPKLFSAGPGCCLGERLDGVGEPVRVHDEVEQLHADEPDIRVLVVLDPVELELVLLKAEEGGEGGPDRVGELEAEGVLLGVVGVGVHGVRIPQARGGCTGTTKKVFCPPCVQARRARAYPVLVERRRGHPSRGDRPGAPCYSLRRPRPWPPP